MPHPTPIQGNTPNRIDRIAALLLMALTLALGMAFVGPAHAQTDAHAGVDTRIQPGDDFFAYANGAWLRDTPIPAGKDRVTARTELVDLGQQRIAELMEHARTQAVGSLARKIADFRTAYLNQAAIEAAGMAPIKPLLRRIDQVRDKADLARLLGSELRADVDPLNKGVYDSAHVLGLSVEAGLHAEKNNVAFLVQGGLGMASRDDYLNLAPDKQALRAAYQTYIARALASVGPQSTDKLPARAQAVLALETALAQSHATPQDSAEDHNADNLWMRADFAQKAPGMDWSAFFAAAGLARQQEFVAWQPGALQGLATLVASTPLQVWTDYLRFHAVARYADVLPQVVTQAALAFRTAQGITPADREQRALEATQQSLNEALGRVYVERYFPAEEKVRLQHIAADVIAAFDRRLQSVSWMSPVAKAVARAKLQTVYFGLGYPETWSDYSGLRISPQDPVGNLQRVVLRDYQQALARVGQPVDKRAWAMGAHRVGAVLLFQQNAYNFPAALLQAPKFDASASDATNYGAIGAIIGHEVSHTIDTLGVEYDAAGALHKWWTPEDTARYQLATQPLVAQYAAYQALPDAAVNGQVTLVENLADLGGLAAAFDAYRASVASKGLGKEALRQQDQQFFIGFARSWRSKLSDEALRKQIATDNHAPDSLRIATVRNLDAWYEAFDVLPGQRLYLEPKARLRIW
nr:M13 family metallopeptidase [Rhodoferax sp.]